MMIIFLAVLTLIFSEDTSCQPEIQSVIDERTLNEEWRWVQFTIETGLPSNHIISVEETNDGIVWALTTKGVARYDGFRWYKIDSSLGLPDVVPRSMAVSPNQELYILLEDGKLYRGNGNGFVQILADWSKIERFVIVDSNKLFFSTRVKMLVYNTALVDSLKFPGIEHYQHDTRDLLQTQSGTWLNSNVGVFKYFNNRWVKKLNPALQKYSINCIKENADGSGVVSIGFPFVHRGIWEWKKDGHLRKNISVRGDGVTTMDISLCRDIIAVEKTGSIMLRTKGKWSIMTVLPNQMRDVVMVRFRRNGDLWVGTKRGLFLFKQHLFYWEHKQNKNSIRNRVHEIIRSVDGTIWLATADGLEKYFSDRSSEMITHIHNKPLYEVTGIAEDNQGKIWIGSGSGFDGTYCWDGVLWKHERIDKNLSSLKIHRIKKDRRGNLWFLALSQSGVLYDSTGPGAYEFDGKKFTNWSIANGLKSGRVYTFSEDLGGGYWFGTQRGLSRYFSGTWKHWLMPNDIPFGKVFTMAVGLDNRVWFSDRTSGLGCIETTGVVQYYTQDDGLPNNNVWDIGIDSRNRIWVSTEGGLGCLEYGKWKVFDVRSGLLTNDLWPIYLEGDSVYVGTKGKGLAILNLRRCHRPTPKIFIDKPVIEDRQAFVKIKPFAYWGEIVPQDVLIRYSLNGNDWTRWSTQHELRFSDLPIGEYKLTVQAQNLFGEYDALAASIIFAIPQPLMFRPIFFLPIGGFAIIVVVLAISIIIRRKNHNAALRRSESKFRRLTEATTEGVVLHSDGYIEDANHSMSRIFGYTHHEVLRRSIYDFFKDNYREVVRNHIASSSPKSIEVMGTTKSGENIWIEIISMRLSDNNPSVSVASIRDISERKTNHDKLLTYHNQLRKLVTELVLTEERERRHMAEYLHDNIGQALAFCKLKLSSVQNSKDGESREKSLKEIRMLIEATIANTRSLTYDLSSPVLYELGLVPAVESLADQMGKRHEIEVSVFDYSNAVRLNHEENIIIYQTIRELLINTVKHSYAKNVEIYFENKIDSYQIRYKDDGIGFDPDMVAGKGGFGLFNAREKLMNIGANFEIISDKEKGMKSSITISLQKNN
jgi:PAS domain S-box-containing protein